MGNEVDITYTKPAPLDPGQHLVTVYLASVRETLTKGHILVVDVRLRDGTLRRHVQRWEHTSPPPELTTGAVFQVTVEERRTFRGNPFLVSKWVPVS